MIPRVQLLSQGVKPILTNSEIHDRPGKPCNPQSTMLLWRSLLAPATTKVEMFERSLGGMERGSWFCILDPTRKQLFCNRMIHLVKTLSLTGRSGTIFPLLCDMFPLLSMGRDATGHVKRYDQCLIQNHSKPSIFKISVDALARAPNKLLSLSK